MELQVEKGAGGCPHLRGLDLLDPEAVVEPDSYAALAREQAPLFFVPETGFYVATRYEDVERVLTDYATFDPVFPPVEVPEEARDILPEGFTFQRAGIITTSNPPQHTRIRKLAQKAFTRSAVLAWREPVREICDDLIDGFAAAGEAELVTAYTSRFPIAVVTAILQVDRALAPQLYEWALDSFRLFGDPAIPHEELMEICRRQAEFERWAYALIAERRADPRGEGDVVTSLIEARDEDGGPRLSDLEILNLIVAMVVAGADTSASTAAQMIHRLLREPELRARALGDEDWLGPFMEEELRINFVGRIVFRQVCAEGARLGDVELPAGAIVGAHVWSANHDERAFAAPQDFDPDRADLGKLLSWGKATHFCLGAPLARLQVTTAVSLLFARLPGLRLEPGAALRRMPSFFMPAVSGGLDVAWDVGDGSKGGEDGDRGAA